MTKLNKPVLVPRNASVKDGVITWTGLTGLPLTYTVANESDLAIKSMIASNLVVYPFIRQRPNKDG